MKYNLSLILEFLRKMQLLKYMNNMVFFSKIGAEYYIKKILLLKNHIEEFFKFVKMEGNSYFELISRREEARDKYLNYKK